MLHSEAGVNPGQVTAPPLMARSFRCVLGKTDTGAEIQQISSSKTQQITVLNLNFSKMCVFPLSFIFNSGIKSVEEYQKLTGCCHAVTFFKSVFHYDFTKRLIKHKMAARSHRFTSVVNQG